MRRLAALALTALIVGACGNTDSWVEAHPADGWPAQYGDAGNSSYTPLQGAQRPGAGLAPIGEGRARRPGRAGLRRLSRRQRPDRRRVLADGVGVRQQGHASAGAAGYGRAAACPAHCSTGSTTSTSASPAQCCPSPRPSGSGGVSPVIGLPMTPRILAPGQLLVITHLGQVLVFDAHRGTAIGTSLDLVDGVDPTDAQRGLADCQLGRPLCPIAAAPAFSPASNVVVVGLWEPNAEAPVVVGLRYRPGQTPPLTGSGPAPPSAAGRCPVPCCPPTARPSTSTAATAGCGRSNTDDGKAKWSVPLNYQPQTPPSVSPDGLIVAGGGPDAKLVARQGRWRPRRRRLEPRRRQRRCRTSSRAGSGVAYTVTRDGDRGMALTVFDPADGHTVNSYPLPERDGVAGRCVDRSRPAGGDRHQRRSGVRFAPN